MRALIFAVFACGFAPRLALEADNAGDTRFAKIVKLIDLCRFGIHDLSRMGLSPRTSLPRFNMPFELGLFLGAHHFNPPARQRLKVALILDTEPERYRQSLSDLAGMDIKTHGDTPETAVLIVRNWLGGQQPRPEDFPSVETVLAQFDTFQRDLPGMCALKAYTPATLTYHDYTNFARVWLREAQKRITAA